LAYVLPALLRGASPLGVALTGAIVIAVGTIYLAHGISDRTTVALVGTIASLLLTAALGASFGAAADLSGLASEESLGLLSFAPELDVRGLLPAATIIGALGVLDDVAITQVSAVWDRDPQSGPSALSPRCLSPRPWPAGSSPSRAVSRSRPLRATAAPTRHGHTPRRRVLGY
jgi:hypothetical protein